jgi:two-component system, NarL family, nitrate/nitrite response regulator NarL
LITALDAHPLLPGPGWVSPERLNPRIAGISSRLTANRTTWSSHSAVVDRHRDVGDKEQIRVFLADDHPVYRQGLVDAIKRRPDLDLVGEADNGPEALQKIQELKPDVAVLDRRMPGDGKDVMRALAHGELETRVVFLSAHIESTTVYEAIEVGASGYISKESDAATVCNAIAAVAQGETVIGAETAGAIADEIRLRAPAERIALSKREREILQLIAEGRTTPDIANQLYLSPATVKTHLQRIYQKLGVSDRAAAVAEAMRRGLLV